MAAAAGGAGGGGDVGAQCLAMLSSLLGARDTLAPARDEDREALRRFVNDPTYVAVYTLAMPPATVPTPTLPPPPPPTQ